MDRAYKHTMRFIIQNDRACIEKSIMNLNMYIDILFFSSRIRFVIACAHWIYIVFRFVHLDSTLLQQRSTGEFKKIRYTRYSISARGKKEQESLLSFHFANQRSMPSFCPTIWGYQPKICSIEFPHDFRRSGNHAPIAT